MTGLSIVLGKDMRGKQQKNTHTYGILGAGKVFGMKLEGLAKTTEELPSTFETEQRVLLLINLKSFSEALECQTAESIGYEKRQVQEYSSSLNEL